MKMIFKDGTGIGLAEDVENSRFLPNRELASMPSDVKELFEHYGYNIKNVPGSFLKMFTVNAKELKSVNDVLAEIEAKGLKEIFDINLDYIVFTKEFFDRVKYCIDNQIPFLSEDNRFVAFLRYKTVFEAYIANLTTNNVVAETIQTQNNIEVTPIAEIQPKQEEVQSRELVLDTEDLMVREELLRILIKLREECNDGTLKFIITSIIANLDNVIAVDNKEYKTRGTRHLIQSALAGVSITPDMQEDINSILSMFPEIDQERGLAA